MHSKFFTVVLDSICNHYDTTPKAVRAKYSAKNPPPHAVLMVRGCFIGMLNSIKISKSEASKFINTSPALVPRAEQYFKENRGELPTEKILESIQIALNDTTK